MQQLQFLVYAALVGLIVGVVVFFSIIVIQSIKQSIYATARRPEYGFFDVAVRERGIADVMFGAKLFGASWITSGVFFLAAALVPDTTKIGILKVSPLLFLSSIVSSIVASYAFRAYVDLPPRHSRSQAWKVTEIACWVCYPVGCLPLLTYSFFASPSACFYALPFSLPVVFLAASFFYTLVHGRILWSVTPRLNGTLPQGGAPPLILDELKLVHVTDLHITDQQWTLEKKPPGQDAFSRALVAIDRYKPTHILLTGDTTDRGHDEEWLIALRALHRGVPHHEHSLRILIAPGNHDISGAYGDNRLGRKLYWYLFIAGSLCPELRVMRRSTGRPTRPEEQQDPPEKFYARRYPSVLGALEEEFTHHAWSGRIYRRIGPSQDDVRNEFPVRQGDGNEARVALSFAKTLLELTAPFSQLDLAAEYPGIATWSLKGRQFMAVGDFYEHIGLEWDKFFPLFFYDAEHHTLFVVVNSVARTGKIMHSAAGELEIEQLETLRKFLERELSWYAPEDPIQWVAILVHNAMFRFQDETWTWRDIENVKLWSFLSTETDVVVRFAETLVSIGEQFPQTQFIVLCGHRHIPFSGTLGRVLILEGGALAEKNHTPWFVTTESGIAKFWAVT